MKTAPDGDLDGARICLIVDHAIRDLPGIAHVATRLAARGAQCFLTPYNLVDVEIWRLAPDFVLLNYFRRNQRDFYQQLQDAGIAYGVLDTEGGVLESLECYGEEMAQSESLRQGIALHCSWGPRLAEFLVQSGKLAAEQVCVTGCPRTDFYDGSLRQVTSRLAPQADAYQTNLILLNSNFSLGNPGFLSAEEQFKFMVSQLGHEAGTVQRWQERELAGLAALTKLANRLSADLPQATVVYRPHPFEDIEAYGKLLDERDNLHCVRSGPIVPWLVHAKAVIQRSCSTSIEAGMSKTPAFTPAWIPTSFDRPAADAAAEWVDNYEELFDRVQQTLDGTYRRPPEVRGQLDDVIENWFYRVDGECGTRVANEIAATIQRNPAVRSTIERFCRRLVYRLNRKPWSKKRIAGQLKFWMGLSPDFALARRQVLPHESERFQRWADSAKSFSFKTAKETTEAIAGSLPVPIPVTVSETRSDGGYRIPICNGVSVSVRRAA